jgi:hypothetical protein
MRISDFWRQLPRYLLAFAVMSLLGGTAQAAHGKTAHPKPRIAIKWPEGCAFFATDDNNPSAYKTERACADTLSAITDWPRAPDDCDYDYSKDFMLDTRTVPPLRFLPLAPGKFLVEMSCGASAYNTSYMYVLYDEEPERPTAKLLRFPFYPFNSGSDSAARPPVIQVTTLSSRAFNRQRKELIVFSKFRGLGDCGIFARYIFPKDEPVSKELRVKPQCDAHRPYVVTGANAPSPKGWAMVPVK